MDSSGNLYVADQVQQPGARIQHPLCRLRFTSHASVRAPIGCSGRAAASIKYPNKSGLSADSLNSPTGVAVDASSNLYVADNGNNRVLNTTPRSRAAPLPIPYSDKAAASSRAPPTTAG